MSRDMFGLPMGFSPFGDMTPFNTMDFDNHAKSSSEEASQATVNCISGYALSTSGKLIEVQDAESPPAYNPEVGPFLLQAIINLKSGDDLDWDEVDKILGLKGLV